MSNLDCVTSTVRDSTINSTDNNIIEEEDFEDERLASLDALRFALQNAPFFRDTINCSHSSRWQNDMSHRCAVLVKDVSFAYNANINVLNHLKMRVPQGKIYALLGSNSSGKTTLLKCIIGRLKPQMGKINVFGSRPGSVNCPIPGIGAGYMPQRMALCFAFTIKETLQYFGQLYRMPYSIIHERTNFLLSLLYLPDENRLIRDLTDGQRWRVSLAVSLIHSPSLLLLDEPTVGVDPLLRCSIWDHLKNLCIDDGLTVIITTHYIEEAGAANMIGLIRGGRLLAEDRPEALLEKFATDSFETVFLKLCQTDSNYQFNYSANRTPQNEPLKQILEETDHNDTMAKWPYDYYLRSKNDMILGRISTMIEKNLTEFRGNVIILLFFLLLPSIQMALFFGSIGKVPKNLSVAIYSPEKPQFLSRFFIRALDKQIITRIKHQTLESAIDSVKRGHSWAAIELPGNYSEALKLHMSNPNADYNSSNVKVYIDMSNAIIGQQLIYSIIKSLREFLKNASKEKFISSPYLSFPIPISVTEVIFGSINTSFTEYYTPGYILVTMFLTHLIISAYLLIKEQMYGHIDRCLATGASSVEVLISHLLSQLILLAFQELIILLLSFVIFKTPLRGSIISLLCIVFLQGTCGISFGLLIGALCPNPVNAMLFSSGTIIPTVIVSGLIWPLESMPLIMQWISQTLPLTLPIEVMRCIISRGMNARYGTVTSGFMVLITYIIVVLMVTFVIFRKKSKFY